MRKFACFALAAALLLAGCGGTDGGNAAQSQPETQTGSTAQESTDQESAAREDTNQTEQMSTQTEETQTESKEAASANGASIKAGDYSYHVESLEKEWTTDGGTLACTVKLAYPVFEGDTEGEKNINAFFEEWADGKLDYYENDKDSIVNYAIQYQTELETEQTSTQEDTAIPLLPPSEEDYSVGGVVVRGSIISVFMESYTYEGGAHGMPGRVNYLFDKMSLIHILSSIWFSWKKRQRCRKKSSHLRSMRRSAGWPMCRRKAKACAQSRNGRKIYAISWSRRMKLWKRMENRGNRKWV